MVWSKKPKMSMEYFLAGVHGIGRILGRGILTVDDEDGLGGILGTGDIYSISIAPGAPCGSMESYKSLGH